MGTTRKIRGTEVQFDNIEQKQLIEQAAYRRGLTVASFVRQSALAEAAKTLKEEQMLKLSDRDWDYSMQTLNNPPESNQALKDLMK